MRKIVSAFLAIALLSSNLSVFAASENDIFASQISSLDGGENISIEKQIINVTHVQSSRASDETFIGDSELTNMFKKSSKYLSFYNNNTISNDNLLKNQSENAMKFYKLSNNNDLDNTYYEVELKYMLKNNSSSVIDSTVSFSSYNPNSLSVENMASGVSDLSFLKTLFILPSSNYGISDFEASINGSEVDVTEKNSLKKYSKKEIFSDYSKVSNLSNVILYQKNYNFDINFKAGELKVLTMKYLVPSSIYDKNKFVYNFENVFKAAGESVKNLKINLSNEVSGYSLSEVGTTFGEDFTYSNGVYSLSKINLKLGSISVLNVTYEK